MQRFCVSRVRAGSFVHAFVELSCVRGNSGLELDLGPCVKPCSFSGERSTFTTRHDHSREITCSDIAEI